MGYMNIYLHLVLKKIFTLLLLVFISSCSNKAKITITKVEGSPLYENAKLSLDRIYQKENDEQKNSDETIGQLVNKNIRLGALIIRAGPIMETLTGLMIGGFIFYFLEVFIY